MNHAFNVKLAAHYSIEISIFVGHLAYLAHHNLNNKRNIHDGLVWSYDTVEALGKFFPYWSKGQRERIIANSVKAGLIEKGNYNQTKYDRTVWYALTPHAYHYFDHLVTEDNLQALWLSISRNQEMDFSKWRNGFPDIRETIPNTIPTTIPKKTTNCESSSSFVFSETIDREMLQQKLSRDNRSDKEFMQVVNCHVENHSDKKYPRMQRAQGALKLLKNHKADNIIFEIREGAQNTHKQSTIPSLKVLYSDYFNDIKSQINLKLLPSDVVPLTFEAWSAENCQPERNVARS